MPLKILSWNIWYHGDLEKINDFLEKSDADVIGLQEVVQKGKQIQLSKHLMEELGHAHVYAPVFQIQKDGQTVNVGNAIFSKYPILKNELHSLSKTDNRIAIEVEINVINKIIHVFNTHLLHTHQKPSKIQEEQAENLIKMLPNENAILMGDFNALPESATIKKISAVFKNTDKNLLPTWSAYPKGCKICLPQSIIYKLDSIFTSPNLDSSSYQVQHSKASDHLPILATVEI